MHTGTKTLLFGHISCCVMKQKLKCLATLTIVALLEKKIKFHKPENTIPDVKQRGGSIMPCECFAGVTDKLNQIDGIMKKYYSQSFSTTYSIVGHGGAGVYLQQSMGRRHGTPWTGCHSIAGQHTNNHAHTHPYKAI
ncbi:hypothetical protein ILYODFUR_011904 [Ilyodon furcidens]|uniref:Uncharacterized protein n=1 Tax=Ilyodon furcidens TaxID=33524 RepID=A0ABV0UV28_9TELE